MYTNLAAILAELQNENLKIRESVVNVQVSRVRALLDLLLLPKCRGFPSYAGTGVVSLENHVLKGYWVSPELAKVSLGVLEELDGNIKVNFMSWGYQSW